ncbi:acyltransferase family protein [Leifsonia shinshuensis]
MRSTELDSLRGAAAFAVLLWHTTASSLHGFLVGSHFAPVASPWYNLIMYSPLRIFSAGPEAVWLFFILSGFVLTRSAASPHYRWDAYYPSRIIRLYLPIIAAVLLTALTFILLPRQVTPANSPFVGGLPNDYGLGLMVRDMTLLTGTTSANVPLWSLQWEVLFSILLPIYVLAARSMPKLALAASVALIVASVWTDSLFLLYMPMFLIGSVLGFHWEAIADRLRVVAAGDLRGTLLGTAGVLVAVFLITSSYTFNFFIIQQAGTRSLVTSNAFTLLRLAGIVLLLCLALTFPPLRRVLRWRPLVALGTISFSLYLTHGPLTIGLAFVMGPGIGTTIVQIVGSLALAVAFYFGVEKWAHRLSRHVARTIRDRWKPAPAPAAAEA